MGLKRVVSITHTYLKHKGMRSFSINGTISHQWKEWLPNPCTLLLVQELPRAVKHGVTVTANVDITVAIRHLTWPYAKQLYHSAAQHMVGVHQVPGHRWQTSQLGLWCHMLQTPVNAYLQRCLERIANEIICTICKCHDGCEICLLHFPNKNYLSAFVLQLP